MEINELKLERQNEGIQKWRRNGGVGTLVWETGVGKTYGAILIMQRVLLALEDIKIYIAVPSDYLRNKWIEDIREHIDEKYYENVEVFTSNELVKFREPIEGIYLLIIDEIHEFFGNKALRVITREIIKSKYILGLTATPPHPIDDRFDYNVLNNFCPIVDVIDEREALQKGFISPFIEYNIGIDLNEDERTMYDNYTSVLNELFPIFNKNLDAVNACLGRSTTVTASQAAEEVAKRNGYRDDLDLTNPEEREIQVKFRPIEILRKAQAIMEAIGKRKLIVHNARNKIQCTIAVLHNLQHLKAICFSESTDFADVLYNRINQEYENKAFNKENYGRGEELCVVYHSNLQTRIGENDNGKVVKMGKTRLRNFAIKQFSTGKARVLSTTPALEKGLNVNDIQLVITTSRNSTTSKRKQQSGRTKRVDVVNPNKTSIVVNIYAKDTVDKTWLDSSQKTCVHKPIEAYSIAQIQMI